MEIAVDFFSSLLQRRSRSRGPMHSECGVSFVILSAFDGAPARHNHPYIWTVRWVLQCLRGSFCVLALDRRLKAILEVFSPSSVLSLRDHLCGGVFF